MKLVKKSTGWGKKTLAKKSKNFKAMNKRRLFVYINRFVYDNMLECEGLINDTTTRKWLSRELNYRLTLLKKKGLLYEFKVICNRKNNKVKTIAENELHLSIYVKLKESQEFLILQYIASPATRE